MKPPSIQYVLRGSHVRLKWEYNRGKFNLKHAALGIVQRSLHPFITLDPKDQPGSNPLTKLVILDLLNISSVPGSAKYYCKLTFRQIHPAAERIIFSEATLLVVSEYNFFFVATVEV